MKDVQVEAQVPENKEKGQKQIGPFAITVKYPETLEEAKKVYGEEAVLSNAFANWRVTLQGNMRSGMKKGETQEQLQQRLGSAVMGVAQSGARVDPVQAYLAQFQNATPEEQQKMLQDLQKRAAKK